jgi:hypothetical protein
VHGPRPERVCFVASLQSLRSAMSRPRRAHPWSGRRWPGSIAAALVATAIAGCGGAGQSQHSRGAHATPHLYRWLLNATVGPQPTVAAENANAGTSTWRLPGPAAVVGGVAAGSVQGYSATQSVEPGQTERIYVSAPGARFVRIRVFRIGWYGGKGGREVLVSRRLRVQRQPPCTHRAATGLTECAWHPTLSFAIPSGLASGVYIAKLTASTGASDCLFVVRATRPQPLLAQLPTATYEAYNAWGGDSLYPGGADRVGVTGTNQGIEVSYDRPYDGVSGAGQFFARDVAMISFLERYGYPVSYTTSESVDAQASQLEGHRAVIDFGHSEYWSARQRDAFARALAAGTSLLFLGSDTLGWRVRYAPGSSAASGAGQPNHSIVAYKEHASLDPDTTAPTGIFADRGAGLSGSAYLGCITPRVHRPGPPIYHYYSWIPSPGLKPSWLFAGTRITPSTRIPGIVGYELDQRTAATPAGTQLVGSGTAPCMSAGPAEPGEPTPGPGNNVAETTLYTARSGALVFDTGTLGWELALEPVPSASPDAPTAPDPRIVSLTRNLLAHVLAGR